jgi:hypothetical protein
MENREAIEWFKNRIYVMPESETKEMFRMAISALEKQEADRWIPVTERLPEEDKGLLVTDGYGEIRHAVYIDWLEKVEFRTIEESITLYDVKAWRPLPEPYTEEEA